MGIDAISYLSQSPPPEAVSFASGSNSPQIKGHSFQKQRSSSINSVGSTHLTRQRSMSIVSLESPRNSIVSTDDFFLKPTRNNSSCSLSSMSAALANSAAVSPVDPPREPPFMGKLSKIRAKTLEMGKSACAIVSDDEFSELEQTIKSLRWRRSSSERPPGLSSSLKRDFMFKYDSSKHKNPLHLHGSSSGQQKFPEDLVPSPLSITGDCVPQEASNVDEEPVRHAIGGVKKTKASTISHSMLMKKKLLFSKDIQLELLSGQPPSPRAASFPNESFGAPDPFASPSIFPKNSHVTTDDTFLHVRPPSPVLPVLPNAPHEMTIRQQTKLISDLNRKWNKSLFHPRSTDFSLSMTPLNDVKSRPEPKKRARSELVSSTDSVTTNT